VILQGLQKGLQSSLAPPVLSENPQNRDRPTKGFIVKSPRAYGLMRLPV